MNHEVLQRRVIHKGPVFDVQQVRMRLPNGRETNYDLVDHRGAAVIVPIDPEGNLIFVRQYRLGSNSRLVEFPAGMLEPGEDPARCAAREVREEIGLQAATLEKLARIYLSPGYSSEVLHIYLAADLTPAPLRPDDDEFIDILHIPPQQAMEMARSGEICDGKTLAALFLVLPYLK